MDPTIHWKTNDPQQDNAVNGEKKRIYELCIHGFNNSMA